MPHTDDARDGIRADRPVAAPGEPLWWAEVALICSRFARHGLHLAGMSPGSASLRALGLLRRIGPLRVTELAERERTSQPTASGLVSRLRRAGLIESTPDPEDGRAQLIGISDRGRAHLAELERAIAESMAGLGEEVTAEEIEAIAAALPVLDRIVAAGPREAPAPPRGDGRTRGLPPAADEPGPAGAAG
ncbi:MarR family winged helix-turn-helix transcriptional regulator [Corynebacterium sphenisci]|uniref:MarR family winged helix-turn-helix transcriptional regulator n=1 Tax=Corynebacterium sphenisci TaxID=191493 RepID=UPI0026DF641E|nr:MarR family transcriptional regulator [Corynebacterium sphenisci]MDO5731898.1 MarR family transcriptional regulator [Corynebacterium sphenisci]